MGHDTRKHFPFYKYSKKVKDEWCNANLPSCFLSAPIPKLQLIVGRFQPRQLLHKLSGSELQLHNESSSKRSESSKLNRSHSSAFHSGWTTSCACSAAAGCWFGWLFGCCCCEVIPVSVCVKWKILLHCVCTNISGTRQLYWPNRFTNLDVFHLFFYYFSNRDFNFYVGLFFHKYLFFTWFSKPKIRCYQNNNFRFFSRFGVFSYRNTRKKISYSNILLCVLLVGAQIFNTEFTLKIIEFIDFAVILDSFLDFFCSFTKIY